jgi:hypothetical protein
MCPACITTVALIIVGAGSVGGLSALVAGSIRARTGAKTPDRKLEAAEIELCNAIESYPETSGSQPASSI